MLQFNIVFYRHSLKASKNCQNITAMGLIENLVCCYCLVPFFAIAKKLKEKNFMPNPFHPTV